MLYYALYLELNLRRVAAGVCWPCVVYRASLSQPIFLGPWELVLCDFYHFINGCHMPTDLTQITATFPVSLPRPTCMCVLGGGRCFQAVSIKTLSFPGFVPILRAQVNCLRFISSLIITE